MKRLQAEKRALPGVLLSVFLMLMQFLLAQFWPAQAAEGVVYIDETGHEAVCTGYYVVEEDTAVWDKEWYVARGNLTISQRVKVSGNVHLILMDNASLTVTKGIEVNVDSQNSSFSVYAQAKGNGSLTKGNGSLTAGTNMGSGDAGIGGKSGCAGAPIAIYGGYVTVNGGNYGAGIGGGQYSDATSLLIAGGEVTANGGARASGIGGGYQGGGGDIVIRGGTVTAVAGKSSGKKTPAGAIGAGMGATAGHGTLDISGYNCAEIRAGASASDTLAYSNNEAGLAACHDNVYVHMEQAETGISYIDKDGGSYTLSDDIYEELSADTREWTNTWYVMKGSFTVSGRITVSGHVSLLLSDGAELTAAGGITVPPGSTLTIFGQEGQSGILTADAGSLPSAAGIGAGADASFGTIEICGGQVTAIGGEGSAGIGSAGNAADGSAGTIRIGLMGEGSVTATGGPGGAGIGGGSTGAAAGTYVSITSGKVTATGSVGASGGGGAGIGGGFSKDGGIIEILGGTVTATGAPGGAGIGGGATGNGGTITISGGTTDASGNDGGAGIGGGNGGNSGTITLSGGNVRAFGGAYGGGIGAGRFGENCQVTINGGSITAHGCDGAVAIGSALSDRNLILGDVRASGGNSASILDGGGVFANYDSRLSVCLMPYARIEPCAEHTPDTEHFFSNERGHWNACSLCGRPQNLGLHGYPTYGQDENEEPLYYYPDPEDEQHHRRDCTVCGYADKAYHEYSYECQNCIICGGGPLVVSYVDANGKPQQHVGCQEIHSSDISNSGTLDLNMEVAGGWYMLREQITFTGTVETDGNINLVLCDGAYLEVDGGVIVNYGNSLTIWSQEEGTGTLRTWGGEAAAGIGGEEGNRGGNITINGGTIYAYGGYNDDDDDYHNYHGGAGIGSGSMYANGLVNEGAYQACRGPGPASVTIANGTVKAEGGQQAAGIGGGTYSSGGNITITGGIVRGDAGTPDASGIGGGKYGPAGNITITGGKVSGIGCGAGAGIGGGYNGYNVAGSAISTASVIRISGNPDVFGYSGRGAGIGTGLLNNPSAGYSTVSILGGVVTANSETAIGLAHGQKGSEMDNRSPHSTVEVGWQPHSQQLLLEGSTKSNGIVPQIINLTSSYRDQESGTIYSAGAYSAWQLEGLNLVPADSCLVTFEEGRTAIDYSIYMPPVATAMNQPYFPPDSPFHVPYNKYFSGWQVSWDGSFVPKGESFDIGDHTEVTLTAQYAMGDNIWVGGNLITAENRSDVLGDGTVSYDAETGVLTLCDLKGLSETPKTKDIWTYLSDPKLPDAAIVTRDRNLTVHIEGSVSLGGENTQYAIFVENGDLCIDALGEGASLSCQGTVCAIHAEKGMTLSGLETLTVSGGRGIAAETGLTVSGIEKLDVSVQAENGCALYSGAKMTLSGIGEIDLSASAMGGRGLSSAGDMKISECGTLYAVIEGTEGYGIFSGAFLNITDVENLLVKAEEQGSYGVYAINSLTLKTSLPGTYPSVVHTVRGKKAGLYSQNGNVVINDITQLTAEASADDSYGIYAGSSVNIVRYHSATKVGTSGGKEGIHSPGFMSIRDATVYARGADYGINCLHTLRIEQDKTQAVVEAEGNNTGIHANWLWIWNATVHARGGQVGMAAEDSVTLDWRKRDFHDFEIEANGGVKAVDAKLVIDDYGIGIYLPEGGAIGTDGRLRDASGQEPLIMRAAPLIRELSFDPGEGFGEMEAFTAPSYAYVTLPDAFFDPPSDGYGFAGWKIGSRIYQAKEEYRLSDPATAVATWKLFRPGFAGCRLRLSGTPGLSFYLEMPEDFDGTGAAMVFDIPGQSRLTIGYGSADTQTVNGKTYKVFECPVYAYQMADTVTAAFHYGDAQQVVKTCSVDECLSSLEETASGYYRERILSLVRAARLYGSCLQPYLSRIGIWAAGYAPVGMAGDGTVDIEAAREGSSLYGYAVSLMDTSRVASAVFCLDVSAGTDLTVSIRLAGEASGNVAAAVGAVPVRTDAGNAILPGDGEDAILTVSGNLCTVSIRNISAGNLGTSREVSFSLDGTDIFAITLSPMSYVNQILSDEGAPEDEKKAMAALYHYYAAAKAY